jgi:phosphatidylserine decarboxylase
MIESLAASIQRILPQHALSALVYRVMRSRTRWLKNGLIRGIGKTVGIRFEEAKSSNPDDYACFNDFFTRELKPGARPIDVDPLSLVSPCDGRISEAGNLRGDRILQAKGVSYRLQALLAGDDCCPSLQDGHFFTIYLSPRDYHRVHMPLSGRLVRMIHVPGKLFSVAPYTVRQIPGLFALNERVVCVFDSAYGPFAQVLVGAMMVGSMSTVWAGEVTPSRRRSVQAWDYLDQDIRLERGEEMGRFNMGSTVVTILPSAAVSADPPWPEPGSPVRMGQRLVRLNPVAGTGSNA